MNKSEINKKDDKILSDERNNGFYNTLITTFSAVFIAELGDKTQVATLLLTAETGSPIIVFLAAASALILTSLIGVLLGRYISKKVDPKTFNRFAAILMISISIYMFLSLTTDNIFKNLF